MTIGLPLSAMLSPRYHCLSDQASRLAAGECWFGQIAVQDIREDNAPFLQMAIDTRLLDSCQCTDYEAVKPLLTRTYVFLQIRHAKGLLVEIRLSELPQSAVALAPGFWWAMTSQVSLPSVLDGSQVYQFNKRFHE